PTSLVAPISCAFEFMQLLIENSPPSCLMLMVGGVPRDILLERPTIKDIDLVCNFSTEQLLEKLKTIQQQQPKLRFSPVKIRKEMAGKVIYDYTLFKVSYEHNKKTYNFEIFCDPSLDTHKNSLITNFSQRNFDTNAIFINSRG